tara:strand:- start:2384 stop:4294 length:1911 start_codon:yes stop_codon:yes gene_type:complete
MPDAPPWRVRLVANLLQGVVRKIKSKMLRQQPIWGAVPATGEPEDILVSRTGTKVLRYYWGGPLMMPVKLPDSFDWMSTCGNVFLRLLWDPRANNEMTLSQDDVSDKDFKKRLGDLLKKKKTVGLGDADVEVVSPFELDPDPSATRMDRATHVIHSKARPIDQVKDLWPEAKGLSPDADDDMVRHFERRIADLAGPNGFGGVMQGGRSGRNDGQIMVHELWTTPVGDQRRGFHAVVAGGKLLALEENEYRYAGKSALPFSHFQEIPVPGRFWGTCALEQAIPIQADYNRSRSQLIENRNLMTRPKWLVPKGANIGDFSLTSEPGEVVEFTPGLPPQAWTPPPLPPYVIRSIEQDRLDLQDVTQIHDVSQGRAPGHGVRSGVAIATLQEADDTVLGPTIDLIKFELERMGAMLLELLSRKVKEERLIKIVGDENLIEAQTFLGKNLLGADRRPNVNYFDVKVEMGSKLPLSREGRVNFLTQLFQAGLLDPQQDRERILQMLEIGSDEPLYDVTKLDRGNAQQENRAMVAGQIVEAQPWDDDELHIGAHREFQKRPDFLRNADPFTVELFERHIAQHEMRISGQQPPVANDPAAMEEQLPPMEEQLPPAPGAPPSPEDVIRSIASQRIDQGIGDGQFI